MKTFAKRAAITTGVLLTALVCMGIVYIDTVQNYWYVNGGFVKLIVSNQTQQAIMTVDTNTLRVGFNTNNTARSFVVKGQKPPTNTTGNGTSAATTGAILLEGGNGGESSVPTTASGGTGGGVLFNGGTGGSAESATTNATGGIGGAVNLTSGNGGAGSTGVASNAATGGNGGGFVMSSGAGGSPAAAATNTAGGGGGNFSMTAGNGGVPSAGLIRKSGSGGGMSFTSGNSSGATATNSGNGGEMTFAAGSSGNATAPGNPGTPGNMNLSGGMGGTGGTNANGGGIFLVGGAATTPALPGDVVLARNLTGSARGGVQIGPLVTGTTATLTNLLTITAVLDFPSIAAGLVADLPVAFAGAADGDVVTVAVPIASVTNCMWMAFASNTVVYVRAANGQLVTAQDPNSGTFRIVLQKFR